jgi:SsrA-binding protein
MLSSVMPPLALNRRATHDYEILEKFEAGLVLSGQEVKSVRGGGMKLQGAYVTLSRGEVWLIGSHIAKYGKASKLEDYDPDRSRKLLLHNREIASLVGMTQQKGLTLVPLSVYARGSKLKLEFGVGRGKKQYEKRDKLKRRDIDRDMRREFGE